MPEIHRLLVAPFPDTNILPQHKEMLSQAAPKAEIVYRDLRQLTQEHLDWAEVCVGNPSLRKVNAAVELKFVQLLTAGADYYFTQPAPLRADLLLASASGAFGLSLAEYAIGGLLALMRKLHLYRDNQRARHWEVLGGTHSIYGSNVLVVGMGDLGTEVAKRLKAFGAYVIGVRRTDGIKPDCVDEQHTVSELDSLLPRADVVILCLPGTPHTAGLFDKRRLHLMNKDAYLVNIGRGTAVDNLEVAHMLRDEKLAGALLDVFDQEPLPPEHPLWGEKNALITPHAGGFFTLPETINRLFALAEDNLTRYAADEPLRNLVDHATGYRRSDF